MTDILTVSGVSKTFQSGGHTTVAVRDMSLAFPQGASRLITIAGESGCGKSTLALMALGFLQPTTGSVLFHGKPVTSLNGSEFAGFRRRVQAVFQNPFEAFNPFYRVSHPLHLALRQMGLNPGASESQDRIADALRQVSLDPGQVLGRFPHQLSGGQLQRIMIARAILLSPELIIADEPVSMVDASLRVLILRHLVELKERHGVSILYITHDLSTALQISDEILIAYQGVIVERGDPVSVIQNPQHDYTKLLVGAVPVPDPEHRWSASAEATSRPRPISFQ